MKFELQFTAIRRSVDNMDCLTCGTAIHQDHDNKVAIPGDEHWYDGYGKPGSDHPPRGGEYHEHAPAKTIGPTLVFDDCVQVTYNTIRFGTDLVAVYNEGRGDWIIEDGYEGAGEAYSDVIITTRP